MAFDTISPGITLVGKFGKWQTGIWILSHNEECAIIEMPDVLDSDLITNPWDQIRTHINDEKLRLKFITATHDSPDHFSTYRQFHKRFPYAPIVVTRHFSQRGDIKNFIIPQDLQDGLPEPSITSKDVPIYCFDGELFEAALGGEPVYLLHAPKYSKADTLVIFRGCLITADWWLGPGDPNPNNTPNSVVNESIDRLEDFCQEKNYKIHSIFSAHANEFRRDVNFNELMESTRPWR
ncbi:MAG TPA: hypothetical protein VKK79_14815 [Candidatus Lokiarchaeia archaeon]|nr:hypothetical protein [Candidatus Lokiarchaeia archaeon]